MSRSLRQPTSQDWSSLLLDAIQKRDAPRALVVALRCVHRQGMGALDSVLDRADAASGEGSDARSWLLPLLKQGTPAVSPLPTPSEQPTSPLLSTPSPAPSDAVAVSPTAPLTEQIPKAESPLPESDSPHSSSVTFTSDTAWPSAPFYAPPALARASDPPPSVKEEEPRGAAVSAALDQAFAPLEIAFPPLPTPERMAAPSLAASTPSSPAPPSFPAPFQGPSVRHEPSKTREPAEIGEPSEIRAPSAPFLASDREDNVDAVGGVDPSSAHEHLLDDCPKGHAAPVPTFQVEASDDSASRPSRKPRRSEPEAADEKGPAPRTLDTWRAWLPGPFRSRSRP